MLPFPRIEVAIKEGSSSNAKEEMLEEAKAMIRVAKHDHIVNFLGISVDGEKVYVLLEFCSFGSIDSFLEKNSENFRMKMECGNYKEVVSWFVQVADAMDFLVKNNIIHVSTIQGPLELEIRKISVSNVVEFPGAGLSRPKTINSEPNGATQTSEAGQASVNFTT